MPVRDPDVQVTVAGDGARVVHLSGAWDIRALQSRAAALQSALRDAGPAQISLWDLTQIQRFDHIGAMLVWRTWGRCRPGRLQIRQEHEIFFGACETAEAVAFSPAAPERFPLLLALGRGVWAVTGHVLEMLRLFGQLLVDAASVARQPLLRPWREFSAGIYKIGVQALGITALVGFLIGVVLSYLSAEQLRLVGADVFIVNILGIGIIRELGPVICSVLVAVSVMGISNTMRLILPKVAAIAVALPLLVLWTSGVALIGGAVSAKAELGMSFLQFFAALPTAVPEVNLWLGVGKGAIFGVLIALIACHFGLRIQPNTASLAAGTTRSVVTSITAVIVADATIAVIFSDVGWS